MRVSLNEVGTLERFAGASGGDVCGVSEVVAKVRSGVVDRGRGLNVDEAKRHRDRGIEAAILKTYVGEERKSDGCAIIVERKC